jgi:hypothetical protein
MKILFALTIIALIAVSFIADYKWKQWIKSRNQNHDR